MNTNEQQKRKGLIAKIKIAQSQLAMEDDVYRAMLARVILYGVDENVCNVDIAIQPMSESNDQT